MLRYGLIGKTLQHSFSKTYFSEKFRASNISHLYSYENYELPTIAQFPELLANQPNIRGLNVTIPYKQAIIPFLDELDSKAEKIGAVNTIRFSNGKLIGYNTDIVGFKQSLINWLPASTLSQIKALILGTGGASQAVQVALSELAEASFTLVSRQKKPDIISYSELKQHPEYLQDFNLIVNTSPLGTYPDTDNAPDIPYKHLSSQHYLYDLVYNPATTLFMKKGTQQGALVKNGYQMLELQAEAAWRIWQSDS
jgi:shikimate dehydrogenase